MVVAGNTELLPCGVVVVVSLLDGDCEVDAAMGGWLAPVLGVVCEDGGWLVTQGT